MLFMLFLKIGFGMYFKQPTIKALTLGRLVYRDALALQKCIANTVREQNLDGIVLLLEHSPVFTIGIRNKMYDSAFKEKLLKTGAEFYATDRGGLVTFHGPGQLVVYPVLNLKHFNFNMKRYVESLEESIIHMCKLHFGIEAHRSPHTGVWVGDNKLCAIGIHGSRYITTHGLAINCNTDLKWFTHITPCGIPDKGVTSLTRELSREVTVNDTIPYFMDVFHHVIKCNVIY